MEWYQKLVEMKFSKYRVKWVSRILNLRKLRRRFHCCTYLLRRIHLCFMFSQGIFTNREGKLLYLRIELQNKTKTLYSRNI